MKIIFKIARAELRTLFYSPIAWITIVVFFVFSGMKFITPLMDLARKQELQITNNPNWYGFKGPLTYLMFIDTIKDMLMYLFLFIPLITMGVVNRELNAGTMKLLTSSPVRIREIVAGKFAGLIGFNLALLSSIALLLFTGYFTIERAEFAWYCSMLLGISLLTGAYMAIGLFISTLTSYQIVAGIATFMAFMLIGSLDNIGQEYDFVRAITFVLSMGGRIDLLISGLITTRDVSYFTLIIILFLGMAVITRKSRQKSNRWTVTFFKHLLLLISIITIGYFTSRPGYIGYLDVTRNKLNTIDSTAQSVLKELDGSPITVTLYTNLLGANLGFGLPKARNSYEWGFWEPYVRFYPSIKFKYEYYYDTKEGDSSLFKHFPNKTIHQIAKQFARINNVDLEAFRKPGKINALVNLQDEDDFRLLMELEYKGKKSKLRTYKALPMWPNDEQVSAAIRKLTKDNFTQVSFTTGHWERSPWRNGEREFGKHTNCQSERKSMINNGMVVDTVSLLNNEIPATTDILVVADPRSALENIEQEKILQYIEKGGNAIIYGEPGKQHILNPILNHVGVQLQNGRLVKPQMHAKSDEFMILAAKEANYMARTKSMQHFQKFGVNMTYATYSGVCDLHYKDTNGFRIEPIIQVPGSNGLWVENGLYMADSAKPTFSPESGDLQKSEYTVGVRLSRMINNKEQRLIVVGDADFMSILPNDIELGFYSWLGYNDYPLYINKIDHEDLRLTIGKKSAKLLWYVFAYVLPGFLLLTGTAILIRRSRK